MYKIDMSNENKAKQQFSDKNNNKIYVGDIVYCHYPRYYTYGVSWHNLVLEAGFNEFGKEGYKVLKSDNYNIIVGEYITAYLPAQEITKINIDISIQEAKQLFYV
jgi:hypothetical protein